MKDFDKATRENIAKILDGKEDGMVFYVIRKKEVIEHKNHVHENTTICHALSGSFEPIEMLGYLEVAKHLMAEHAIDEMLDSEDDE